MAEKLTTVRLPVAYGKRGAKDVLPPCTPIDVSKAEAERLTRVYGPAIVMTEAPQSPSSAAANSYKLKSGGSPAEA